MRTDIIRVDRVVLVVQGVPIQVLVIHVTKVTKFIWPSIEPCITDLELLIEAPPRDTTRDLLSRSEVKVLYTASSVP